jgi:hypothetical protein
LISVATPLRLQRAAGMRRNVCMRSATVNPINATSQTGVQLAPRRQALFNWLSLLTLVALIFV